MAVFCNLFDGLFGAEMYFAQTFVYNATNGSFRLSELSCDSNQMLQCPQPS